jgi:small subunit ribosomal protein S8
MMTDPVGDMLTRIRNAARAGHPEVSCASSRLKLNVARVLVDAGFLESAKVVAVEGKPRLEIRLRYAPSGKVLIDGIRRISRPSRRVFVDAGAIPKVRNGLGVAVLSTNKGVISDAAARAEKVGGEVVCEVW